jgi:acyl-CoA thioester hydrolase
MDNKSSASVRIRVPFYDVDMLQIVWHGHYFKYFDLARQALFIKCGFDMTRRREKQYIFPVVRTHVKYLYPLKINDEFICTAKVRTAKVKLVIDFDIRLAEDGRLCATGRSEHAAVRMPQMEMEFRIPEEVEKALISAKVEGDEENKPSDGDSEKV